MEKENLKQSCTRINAVRLMTSLLFAYVLAFSSVPAFAAAGGGWVKDNSGWWYRNADGSYPTAQWKSVDGQWYYFNNAGYMETGWHKIKGTWYYLKSNGAMTTGWNKVKGVWYYHAPSGAMKTGWNKVASIWYYHNNSGVMVVGWQSIGGKWYYFDDNGAMVADSWVGNYYLKSDGSMATNQWIGKYHVNANGVWDKTGGEEDGTVVGDRYYDANGDQIIFNGSYYGSLLITDGKLNCYGAVQSRPRIVFGDYDSSNNTYFGSIDMLFHFHGCLPRQGTSDDDLLTSIPFGSLEGGIDQKILLAGGDLYRDDHFAITCTEFNPTTGCLFVNVENSYDGGCQIDRYVFELLK